MAPGPGRAQLLRFAPVRRPDGHPAPRPPPVSRSGLPGARAAPLGQSARRPGLCGLPGAFAAPLGPRAPRRAGRPGRWRSPPRRARGPGVSRRLPGSPFFPRSIGRPPRNEEDCRVALALRARAPCRPGPVRRRFAPPLPAPGFSCFSMPVCRLIRLRVWPSRGEQASRGSSCPPAPGEFTLGRRRQNLRPGGNPRNAHSSLTAL